MIAKLSKRFGTIFDRIVNFLASVAGVLLISMMLIVCYEVVMRYFFRNPQAWVVEISEDMLLYITFLGTAWLLRERGHVAVDVVLARLNPKTKLLLNMITSAMGVIMCLVLTWYSGESTWDHFQGGVPVVKTMEIPKAILLGVMPVGFFTLSVQFLRNTSEHLGHWRTSGKKELQQ